MREYKIYIFRHGKTTYNQKGIFTGWKNPSITPRGKLDALRIARKLKNKKFEIAFHTRLIRSVQTLNIVLKYHPECKKILEDDRLIERSYGVLEGTSHKSFVKRIGKNIVNLEVEGDALANLSSKLKKEIEKFLGEQEFNAIHRGYNLKVPKGESFLDVEKRVSAFISHLKKLIKKHRCNVAISAHGNSVRIFRKIMEKASKEKAIKWVIPYDDFYEYSVKA